MLLTPFQHLLSREHNRQIFPFNFLNNLILNLLGKAKPDSGCTWKGSFVWDAKEDVCMRWAVMRSWSAGEDSIHVWRWFSLGFQNPSRIMRVSTWRSVLVGCWSNSRIRRVSMQSEGVRSGVEGQSGVKGQSRGSEKDIPVPMLTSSGIQRPRRLRTEL